MSSLPTLDTMHRAFARKDPAFEGLFFVAVKTTGVFCRPTCRAKPPRPENVQFFPSAQAAIREGYRPCKLCRPEQKAPSPPAVVQRLMQWLDEHPTRRMTEHDLRQLRIDPSTARRRFRAYCGTTFAGYQRARSLGRGLATLRRGASAIEAQLEAGFESAGGFREALARAAGGADRAGLRILTWCALPTPLGKMIAVAGEQGIMLLDFADRKGLKGALQRLKAPSSRRGEPAGVIVPGEHPHLTTLRRELDAYFAGTSTAFSVPLALRGTEFQLRAWQSLRAIPPGQTRSYAQQAAALGRPSAVRAVARANGANYLAIIIPCHRVIGADGLLTGYGGGLARKRWLLDHERLVRDESASASHAAVAAAPRDVRRRRVAG